MRFEFEALFSEASIGGMTLTELGGIPNASRIMMPSHLKNTSFSSTGLSLGLQPNSAEMQLESAAAVGGVGPGVVANSNDQPVTKTKRKQEENDSRSGSGSEIMGTPSGEEQEAGPPRKKRYHRHTAKQIQEMEACFKECPHPDDKQRQELSRDLGLEPRQVKFWFQNRRTQMKTQHERAENNHLRMEVDKLRAENITMREAIRTACCPSCGGPQTMREMTFDEQHLRIENSCLKDELERLSKAAASMLNNHFPGPPVMFGASTSPTGSNTVLTSQVLDDSSNITNNVSTKALVSYVSEDDKAAIYDAAISAMDEVLQLSQSSSVWIPNPVDGSKEIFDCDEYSRQFPKSLETRQCGFKTDSTRETGIVTTNAASIVEVLMNSAKWMELFATSVSKVVMIEVLSSMSGTWNGTLQLMYAELQVLSPMIETRKVYFFRYCKQLPEGIWAVVDVSADGLRGTPLTTDLNCRRCPSGFIIQDMDPIQHCSKVTVVEHTEYEDKSIHQLFRDSVSSGEAFGARKWLVTLQRQCEAQRHISSPVLAPRDISVTGRQNIMKLSQRMTNSFCWAVGASTSHAWTPVLSEDLKVMTRRSVDNPGEPQGIILTAATTLWLQASPQRVFDYVRLEHIRSDTSSEWDIPQEMIQEIARIAKSDDTGNNVSLFKIDSHQKMFLQESCTDASGSVVVYAPLEMSTVSIIMQGGDPAHAVLLPSGFAIMPDGSDVRSNSSSSSNNSSRLLDPENVGGLVIDNARSGGTLLTFAVQMLISNLPTAKISIDSVMVVNKIISATVQKVKAALAESNNNEQ